MRIDFYHLQKSPLEKAFPQLVKKVLESGQRAVVMAGSDARVESLNSLLWTYDQKSWLPHGSVKDGNAEEQPIWLTIENENPNGATILILTDGMTSEKLNEYDRCLNIFDGNDNEAVTKARTLWKEAKTAGNELHYWQQTELGGWKEKATA
ncbi:MAG: DNA polymerase III subunit chi [Alphaproteobacteria bacterium]|nr:DNA polymerase III subunit chi [Alphaproteobacteria bacterium]